MSYRSFGCPVNMCRTATADTAAYGFSSVSLNLSLAIPRLCGSLA